jgi:mono/diheme cytochrome c family protein
VAGCVFAAGWGSGSARAASSQAEKGYREKVEPVMVTYCFDCHGDGAEKGDVSLDFADAAEALGELHLWERVWHNLRSHLMPPVEKKQPTSAELAEVTRWIEREVFRLDPERPDPGRVTIRRLNRQEYRYSVLDLLGVDYRVDDNFPPDDTGYGFDTIGDVLSLSPLLLEKYLAAAAEIAEDALPLEAGTIPVRTVRPEEFKPAPESKANAKGLPFGVPAALSSERWVNHDGDYKVEVIFKVTGSEEATENTATLRLRAGETEVRQAEIGWDTRDRIFLGGKTRLAKGKQRFELFLEPAKAPREGEKPLVARVEAVRFEGPLDGSVKEYSSQYQRIMFEGPPPPWQEGEKRREYARKIFARFGERAFRRPVDDATLDRLVKITVATDALPDTSFEEGIRQGLAALLVSPRFLFRAETQPKPDDPGTVVELDEFALASRLSYFLWSSLPDTALLDRARKGELRANLTAEVDRMLQDAKSDRFISSFVGQWLQARDVTTININPRAVLGSKSTEDAYREFSGEVRRDMQRESELLFAHVLRENRPVTELLTADYAFLSEKLAKFYGIPGVEGREMERVQLPPDSKRGGILRQANFLVVTSNPTRTSPVKRGLFVLENVLATPAPPAPPNVPALEAAKKPGAKNPTMRELMEIHRQNALCKSCHARMDPIGLAFEHYNAIGLWRDDERGAAIQTDGKLVTGETFDGVEALIWILATSRKTEVHRAMVEKLMTYALGRGMEYPDMPEIERIVAAVEQKNGTLRAVLDEVVASAAFQKRRGDGNRLAQTE